MQFGERGLSLSGYERDTIFLNVEGKKFVDISGITGLDSISDGRGAVFADFDNDGAPDIFLPTIQGDAHLLFRNEIAQRNGWIRISLTGSASGRDAYGASVRVKSSQGIQTKFKSGGEGFMSQHDPRLLFGIGADPAAEWIEVRWPSGKVTHIDGPIAARTSLTIDEATSNATTVHPPPSARIGTPAASEAVASTAPVQKRLVLTGENASGHPTRIALQRRTVIVLWATWCLMCRQDLDTLVKARADLSDRGYDIVAASIDDDAEVFRNFMAKRPLPFPVIRLSAKSRKAIFGSHEVSVPAALMFDENAKAQQWLSGRSSILRWVHSTVLTAERR